MPNPELKTFSFHLSPKHKALGGIIGLLVIALVIAILLAAASVAAVLAIGGAAVAIGAGVAGTVKRLFSRNRQIPSQRIHGYQQYEEIDTHRVDDLDPRKRIDPPLD